MCIHMDVFIHVYIYILAYVYVKIGHVETHINAGIDVHVCLRHVYV